MKKLIMTLIVTLTLPSTLYAQADIEAGKLKTATCIACHGSDGNSPINTYPKLAGQHATYLQKQLLQFQSGERNDPTMTAMSATLSAQDIRDIAAFYMSQTTTPEMVSPEVADAGQKLYMGGNLQRNIPACTACHGPRGNGLALAKFPKISSQHPSYLKAQLQKFRDKTRNNDQNAMMTDIAAQLSDDDIELLSQYISALH